MRITKERMNELLPPGILESELDLATKKVLAALCDWYLNSKATESKIVIIDNKKLVYIAGVGGNSLQTALRQLQDYNLIDRKIGAGLGNASQYIINFKQMVKPLKRKTFAELFNLELDEEETLEKPISTIVKNSILQVSTDKSITSKNSFGDTSSDNSISDKSSIDEVITDNGIEEDVFRKDTYLNKLKRKGLENQKTMSTQELVKEMEEGVTEPNSKNENEGKKYSYQSQLYNISSGEDQDCISGEVLDEEAKGDASSQSQSSEKEPRPTNHKQLQDYFHKRLRQEFKEKIPESDSDIEQSRERLCQELEGFSDISDYRLVGYMIKSACEKETDRLMERVLNSP